MKLYQIASAYQRLADALADGDGELTCDIDAELGAIHDALESKVENICKLVRQLEANRDAAKAEAKRLNALADAQDNGAQDLRAYLLRHLAGMGLDGVRTPLFRVSRCRNGQPSIRWDGDPDALPPAFRKATYSLDGAAARSALKAGRLPDGFRVEYGENLRIG